MTKQKSPQHPGAGTAGGKKIETNIVSTPTADGNMAAKLLARLAQAIVEHRSAHVALYTQSLCRLLGRWAAR